MRVKKFLGLSILLSHFTAIGCPSCIANIRHQRKSTCNCKYCVYTTNDSKNKTQFTKDMQHQSAYELNKLGEKSNQNHEDDQDVIFMKQHRNNNR